VTKAKAKSPNALDDDERTGKPIGKMLASAQLGPFIRHACVAGNFAGRFFGDDDRIGPFDLASVLIEKTKTVDKGDLTAVSGMLLCQAVTLDAVFTDMVSRAASNLGEYPLAADRYFKLGFKAQSASRATLEALARLHQPREQVIKHVHVNEGGQAIVAEQFHHHAGGKENGKSNDQSHAARNSGECSSLSSLDSLGDGVPISSGERQKAV
jgi:hypothetical protein